MERKFKVGDKVKLVAGSPEMVIGGYPPEKAEFEIELQPRNPPGNYYICEWFEGNRSRSREYHEDVLTKVTP